MILPDPISHGQLERSYGLGFMRFMLPSVLSYGGRNSTVAEKVSILPIAVSCCHALALSHAGENAGALSAFTLLPELDAAIVVLGNTTALGDENELVRDLLASQLLNPNTEVNYPQLATEIADQCRSWHEGTITKPLEENQIQGTNHGPLSDYIGVYVGLKYAMSVDMEGSSLVLHDGGRESQRAVLRHYHYDTFSFATTSYDEHMRLGLIDYDDWRLFLVQFERDYTGKVIGVRWFLDANIAPVLLRRLP
jgi:hypothetical protein